jgi:hypothetical protein
VVKLVDALDSKSSGPQARVGSIPTSGTKSKSKAIQESPNARANQEVAGFSLSVTVH